MHVPRLESRVLSLHPAPSEDALLRRALAAQSAVHMAEGALAVLGPVPLAEARRVLVDLGRAAGMDVVTVAEHLLNVVQGREAPVAVTDGLHRVLAPYRQDEPLV